MKIKGANPLLNISLNRLLMKTLIITNIYESQEKIFLQRKIVCNYKNILITDILKFLDILQVTLYIANYENQLLLISLFWIV